jgi:hypothetical protein
MGTGSEKNNWWAAAGAAGAGGDVTYFGDGSDGSVTFDGSTTDGMSAGANSYGYYYIDGTTAVKGYPLPLSASTDKFYEITVANKSGDYDGDMALKQYTSLTIDADYILTTDQPCAGLMVLVDGNCTINGWLSMTARGAFREPTGVATGGLDLPVKPSGGGLGEDLTGGAVFDGCGTAVEALEGSFPNTGTGSLMNILKVGMPANGDNDSNEGTFIYHDGKDADNYTVTSSWGARPTDCGKSGEGGAGGGKSIGMLGGAGTCFSGGSGAGGAYAGQNCYANSWGGAGTVGQNSGDWSCGGGAGNPGGASVNYSSYAAVKGGDGTGGVIILLVSGDLTIGAAGGIYCRGVGGASGDNNGNSNRGGSSGGGNMIVGYGGTLSNSGTIDCGGGFISVADNDGNGGIGTGSQYLRVPSGGDGSTQLINLNA